MRANDRKPDEIRASLGSEPHTQSRFFSGLMALVQALPPPHRGENRSYQGRVRDATLSGQHNKAGQPREVPTVAGRQAKRRGDRGQVKEREGVSIEQHCARGRRAAHDVIWWCAAARNRSRSSSSLKRPGNSVVSRGLVPCANVCSCHGLWSRQAFLSTSSVSPPVNRRPADDAARPRRRRTHQAPPREPMLKEGLDDLTHHPRDTARDAWQERAIEATQGSPLDRRRSPHHRPTPARRAAPE
jgi:hypothetical protein